MRKPALSISTKLTALIVVSVGLIVGMLTALLSARQVVAIHQQLEDKADVYGALAADELQSAIAFRDAATAREVLDSLSKDPDLVGATVYLADGVILLHVGSPTANDRPTDALRHVVVHDRGVDVISPIVSKEGPRGSVVLELASERSDGEQHDAVVAAIAFGLAMLIAGGVAAWLITRRIARRVQSLTEIAEIVADGVLEITPPFDASTDEVGRLARAFDKMVVRLRESFAESRALAEQKRVAIEQANLELERRIEIRTSELRRANSQIKRDMDERAQMEIDLRQAQKLEAVGRLAAGVAHELNTPIQFVTDSCTFIDGASTSFIEVIGRAKEALARVQADTTTADAEAEAFAKQLDTADFTYLAEQVPPAVVRALDGLNRMATIVQSMKEFSHPDQTEKMLGDVNRGLLSTIEIARNEYKYVADLTTELGELPAVVCHIGELNQAFLNIIVNAAHAIAEIAPEGERGSIVVKTWATDDEIKIAITDTGAGIPENIRDRIFDPFFTTKEVGKGTGQGLAIARSVIVDKHAGRIAVDSTVGKGTTFTLSVPYRDVAAIAA